MGKSDLDQFAIDYRLILADSRVRVVILDSVLPDPAELVVGRMTARSQRILLVDDDDHVRETVGETLRRYRHDVTAAGSFAAGREILIATQPTFDLVITDIRLGDGTGIQLAREIVENIVPPPRILLISAYLDDPGITALLVNGQAEVLLKPFALRALLQHIAGTRPAQAA